LLKIENATIKYRGQVFFEDLNFEIRKNEQWAVVGESGSGKSIFLHVLAGCYVVSKGGVTRTYYEQYTKEHQFTDLIGKLMSYSLHMGKFRFSVDRGGTFTDVYAEVPGKKGKNIFKYASGGQVDLGGKNEIQAKKGDSILILTPGGGGYGRD